MSEPRTIPRSGLNCLRSLDNYFGRDSISCCEGTKHQGFTALQIVIVAALVGILVAIALPQIGPTLQLRRLDNAASLFASKLAEARMNAIKRNRQAWVLINPTDQTMRVQTTDNGGATIDVGPAERLPEGVDFASPTAPTQIRFDSLGRIPTGTAAWTIMLRGVQNTRSKSISISVAGKVTVNNMNHY